MVEIDMPYYEREGQSKLRVMSDGLRFLGIILETTFLYHPARLFGFAGLGFLGFATGLMAEPVMHYLKARSVEEWMLYRFILGHLAATLACLMFAGALLTRRVVQIAISKGSGRLRADWIDRLFLSPGYWAVPFLLILCGAALVGPNLVARATSHEPYEHWSRFITMSFFFLIAGILISARLLSYFLDLVAEQLYYLRSHTQAAAFDEKDDSSTVIDRAAV
jgi:drug/metabolite transporter (DMT)-like permease